MNEKTEVKDRFADFLRELETLETDDGAAEALLAQKPNGSNYW